jgi:hypothetical protein
MIGVARQAPRGQWLVSGAPAMTPVLQGWPEDAGLFIGRTAARVFLSEVPNSPLPRHLGDAARDYLTNLWDQPRSLFWVKNVGTPVQVQLRAFSPIDSRRSISCLEMCLA